MFRGPEAQISFVAQTSDKGANPQDRIGDPIRYLTATDVDHTYRQKINRGELSIPTWGLHEALRISPLLGNYVRLWCGSLSSLDWSIKTGAGAEGKESQAEAQATALEKAYNGIDITGVVEHLALADLYGYSHLARAGSKVEPLNWWAFARDGLYGNWFYNPDLLITDGRRPVGIEPMKPEAYITREATGCLLEYLRLFLRVNEIERYWDSNLEKESRRQVVVIPGQGLDQKDADDFRTAAEKIAQGESGCLAPGSGDKITQVTYPPESRGLPYYENRLKMLEEWACKALFGSSLIANTESGSGTLAGGAHSETARRRIAGAAMSISSAMQRDFDTRVLREANLLADGESPLVYFELSERRAVDPDKEVTWTATLAAAGYKRDVAELSERTGMTLTEAPPQNSNQQGREPMLQPPASGLGRYFSNSSPAAVVGAIRETIGAKRLAAWDKPLREYIEKLLTDLESGDLDAAALDKLETAIEAMPADLLDAEALAKYLEQAMSDAMVKAVEAEAKAVGGEA